jgi:hypothetical protein
MKRVAILILILLLGTAMLGAQESKTGSVGLMFTDSFAFAGIYGELFLGNLGLGATFTALPWGSGDTMVILYEPGFYGRFYMGDIASAMYLMGGMTYLTAAGSSESGSIEGVDAGVLNVNGGIGYNALLGNNNATRFSLEIGPRYSAWRADGDEVFYEGFFLHFALYFGATF